jgi:PAS domain S-box-containing protein
MAQATGLQQAPGDTGVDFYMRRLVDHVPSMLAYWDRDLRCRFANRAYEQWFGVDPDRLIGTSIVDLLGPELFAANEIYSRGALRGEPQTFERIVPGPNGAKRHSLATYVPDIVDGEVKGFFVHVTETTQLKAVEQKLRLEIAERARAYALLRASELALREAQRLGQIGSWQWNASTDVTTWSDELFIIFGWDPDQPPLPFAEQDRLYVPASLVELRSAVDRALKSGVPYVLELEFKRPDGSTGWLEARGEVMRDAQGRVQGLRGTGQDVSLRHSMEEARVRAQVAEAANRNKTRLLSRVSHELRTPLNGLLGFAQLCRADPQLPAKYRQWSEHMVATGEHMLQLVNEVLDLSAAEAGQIVFTPGEVDFAALVSERMDLMARAAADAGVSVQPLQRAGPIRMRADATRLRQIVDNLLSNAVKYTPRGGRVTASVGSTPEGARFEVNDTGIGLRRDQIDRLFLPFERLGAERTTVAGTGLGLALTKSLIDLMGGSISVTSTPGKGSTFVVVFPLGR